MGRVPEAPLDQNVSDTTIDKNGKQFAISTRENSDYKWKTQPCSAAAGGGTATVVLGCLEVPSEPDLLIDGTYTKHVVNPDAFDYCMDVWDDWNMLKDFRKAAHALPRSTGCCGLVDNSDETIKSLMPLLNRGWIKAMNKKLKQENKGFKLDCFIWNWHNATGKAETNILLIRFFEFTPSTSI